uniref:Unannotated protein n=1 Tax=freshwater metagenome TaxID=449393 RepID=A0A6J7MXT6_9ZZZZ
MAGHRVSLPAVHQCRFLDGTAILRPRAAGAKATARRGVERARHLTVDREPSARPLETGVRDRHCREQRPGVRVRRCTIDVLGRADLDNLSEVHHRHPVRDVANDGQVVGDEEVREPQPALQFVQQVHDTGLDRHVEGRHRLVEHEDLRVEGERPCHADALALATGELVRVPVAVLGIQPDDAQQFRNALCSPGGAVSPMHLERLGNGLVDLPARVERRVRILKDDLHLGAQRSHLLRGEPHQFAAPVPHRARRGFEQLQHAPGGGGLATTALADEAEGLALL